MAFIPVNQGGAMAGGLAAQMAQQPAPGVPYTDQAAIDRKRRLAEMLAQNSQRPVDSGLGAASALAQALVGRFKEKKADKLDAQNAEYRRTALAQAIAEKDPAMQAMLLARAQDPNLQEFGIKRSFGLQDEARAAEAATANYQRERTDKVADREDAQSFQTDMYGRQESAAERRAREQREFTAQENALNRGSQMELATAKAGAAAAKGAQKEAELAKKQQSALKNLDGATTTVIREIDKALALAHPGTTGLIGEATKGIGGSTTFTLNRHLDTIKANTAFNRLQQMRADSPTGGALGNVSNIELDLLGSVEGSLALGQKTGALKETLTQLRDKLTTAQAERRQLMGGGLPAGGGQGPQSGAAPPPAAIAELRANPATTAQFDEIFGPGAAERALKNGQ